MFEKLMKQRVYLVLNQYQHDQELCLKYIYFFISGHFVGDCLFDNFGGPEKGRLGRYS